MQEFLRLNGLLKLLHTAASVDMAAFDHMRRMRTTGADLDKVGDLTIPEAMWNLAILVRIVFPL